MHTGENVGWVDEVVISQETRKLSYRKDGRTMRHMYEMGALKIFGSPWLRPWPLSQKILTGFFSDWAYKRARKIWSS